VRNSRLSEICQMIKPGFPIADIGSDHARLPLFLLENQLIPGAVVTEMGDGPYIRMERAVSAAGFTDQIAARQGDGLQVLRAGEVEGVVIAGMGGDLISAILSHDWGKAESFTYYLLQPMSRAGVLRKTLADRGWPIIDEVLVRERGQYYVIIHAHPGREVYLLSDLERELGPIILKQESPLKKDYLKHYLNKYKKVHDNLLKSNGLHAPSLRSDMQTRIRELEAIIDGSQG